MPYVNPTIEADIRDMLYDMFPQAICVLDQQINLVYLNEHMMRLTGWSGGVLGHHFFELLPTAQDVFLAEMEEVKSGKAGHTSVVYDASCLTEKQSWWEVSIHSLDEYIILIITDITEPYLLKQQIRFISNELELFHQISDPMVIINQQLEIKYTNRAFNSLFEHGQVLDDNWLKELYKRYDFCNFKGHKLKSEDSPITKLLRGEEVYNQELQILDRVQKIHTYFYVSAKPIVLEFSPQEKHYIFWMREVSSLINTTHTRKDFIQTAAHEMRTPITSIKGFTQLVFERYNERTKGWYFKPTIELMKDLERDHIFFKIIFDEVQLASYTTEV